LERYGHQVVIGNDLHRRKFEVVFVSRKISTSYTSSTAENASDARQQGADTTPEKFDERWLRINIPEGYPVGFPVKEIEEDIVEELVKRHTEWIGVHGSREI